MSFLPQLRHRPARGVSLTDFGLVVALVAIVVIGAVAGLGSSASAQFDAATSALDGVDAGSSGGSAGPEPTLEPTPEPTPPPMNGDFDSDAMGPGGVAWPTTWISAGSHDGSGYMNARALDGAQFTFSPAWSVSADDMVSVTMMARAESGGTKWHLCTAPTSDMIDFVCTAGSALPTSSWASRTLNLTVPYGHAYAAVRFEYTVFYDDVDVTVTSIESAGTVLDTASFDADVSSDQGLTYPTTHYATGGPDGFGYLDARTVPSTASTLGPSYPVTAGHDIRAEMLARTASGGGTYWELCTAANAAMSSGLSCTSMSALPSSGVWTWRSLTRTVPAGHAYAAIRFNYSVQYDLLRLVDLDG